jgi:hypothetical protein
MAYTTIDKSSLHFNTVTWTGNASTNAITGVGFQPDLVWGKSQTSGYSHQWYDAVRGATYSIKTANNGDAVQETLSTGLTAFGTDGFTLGNNGNLNTSGHTVTGWNWKGANGTSSNSDGSITSTVSANTTSGFSIVKWTASGSNSTIGHGLGAAPKVILAKALGATQNWRCYFKAANDERSDVNGYIPINTTEALSSSSTVWQGTAPTTSVFSVGTAFTSGDYIAYCFAEKTGFSKFGQYAGNSNADGAFIYLGFKPAFVLGKKYYGTTGGSGAGDNWEVHDNNRDVDNPVEKRLFPNTTDGTNTRVNMDFLSNGFKIRSSSGEWNEASNNYIFMAFAEAPLVGSNNIPATAR